MHSININNKHKPNIQKKPSVKEGFFRLNLLPTKYLTTDKQGLFNVMCKFVTFRNKYISKK